MQVKTKFKQTEIGLIPEDWQVKKLSEISPSQSVGLVINPSSYYDTAGTVPLLVGSNIHENYIEWQSANKISEESNRQLPASRLVAGDLVTVRVGEPGITAVVPAELDGCNCASMMIVRQHRSFNSSWLCFMMNSKLGRSRVENVQYGTAQKQFNISDAINFKYPVPPLPEQRAVAAALSDVDALINSLDRLIAKKRDIKQATMQQLLTGKTRLPGFTGDWVSKRFDDIADIDSDNLGSSTNDDYVFNYISLEDVEKGSLKSYTEQYFSSAPSRARRKLTYGDILVSTVRPNLQSHLLFTRNEPNWICSTGFSVARCKPELANPNFVFFSLFGDATVKQIESLLSGSNYPAINGGDVKRLEFLLPLPDEQTAISNILSDLDTELSALEVRRDKTRLLKQGMMQELLTGRTRLV